MPGGGRLRGLGGSFGAGELLDLTDGKLVADDPLHPTDLVTSGRERQKGAGMAHRDEATGDAVLHLLRQV